MGVKGLIFALLIATASAQTYKVCILSSSPSICQSLDKDGSRAICETVESRVDCALKLARGEADIGVFSEEEMLLLAQMQPNDHRVVATVRDSTRTAEPYAFEAVAVVPNRHTGGLEGLRGGKYCHPGLDQQDQRWSPRVLKTLELTAAQTDRCSDPNVAEKTADQLEVETLSQFFSAGCRPGSWSANATVDAQLKSQHTSLCSLCGDNTCNSYTINMGISVAGARNDNRHIQALECLRVNSNGTEPAVAYAAWQHVREYFNNRNPQDASSFSLLCPDGTLQPLSLVALANTTAPCSFVKQPHTGIVTSTAKSTEILTSMQTWWPSGASPNDNSWQAVLFTALAGGTSNRVVFETAPGSVANYVNPIRQISNIDATATCLPARRWCTLSPAEQTKCTWVRTAAYSLGITPTISCQQRPDVLTCLRDIRDDRVDFISSPSNYGYLARQHYKLSPVKMVQNQRAATARVAAIIKETSNSSITRFENLRGKKACFPEYGGLAYVAFVRAAQIRDVISRNECDYGKAVSEFFSEACAPGAEDASHKLNDAGFDANNLCSLCRPSNAANASASTCAYDYTNRYYGNNGSLACLADPNTDVAFVNIQNISTYLTSLNLQASQFRVMCINNTLASTNGVNIDDDCLLAHVVDAEVLTRRRDPLYNSLNVLFDTLDLYFGYNAATGTQHINLEIFSSFDGVSDLLFKDSTIGLTEPTSDSTHVAAKNYIELFSHLNACTGSAPPMGGFATRSFYSTLSLIAIALMTLVAY